MGAFREIALAAFLLLGYWVWPSILVGAFLVNLTTAGSVATSLSLGVGNTLEGLLGAYLVNRFAPREAATAVFFLAGISIWWTLHGYGPFVRASQNESLLLLQAFMGVSGVMTLALAAVVGEFRRGNLSAR